MKNPGHKRSISGYSQPSQSKYSQNSLLNTMIRVNKIGGVASNLDSSAVTNGTRPSISPYRKNSNSREATPKTAVSRNSGQTAKIGLDNLNSNNGSAGVLNRNNKLNNSLNANYNFGVNNNNFNNNGVHYGTGSKVTSKTPPPMQPKRIQSTNNFALRPNGLLNSVTGLSGSQRGNKNNSLMSSFANNSQGSFGFNKINNSSTNNNGNSINNRINNSIGGVNNHSNNKDRHNNSGINSLSSSSYNLKSGRNFFSKINNNNNNNSSINSNSRNIASAKQTQTNQQSNLLSGLLESSLAASGNRSNRASNNLNNNINNNNNKALMKNGTKITIDNDNLTQKKFEKNLNNKAGGGTVKNRTSNNNNSEYSNSPLNNSIEKSSTSSFNSAYDRIKVNKSGLLLQQQKNKLNSLTNNTNINVNLNSNNNSNNTTNNNNNNSNNNSNNDVLSSLLNSKNYSKSPNRKSPSPALQQNSGLIGDLNKSPNNLNILGKSGLNAGTRYLNSGSPGLNNFSGLSSSNDLFSKIYSINSQSRKNLEISQKQGRDKSKTPSSVPISGSLNNLNILNNLKMNKNLLAKNAKNLSNVNNNNINNNIPLKKINALNNGNASSINANSNSQTIQVNKIKNNLGANNAGNPSKNNEVRGTIIEMNSEEFSNKLTGKFGGRTKESFYSVGNNNNNYNNNINNNNNASRSNSNNNSQNNSNNNFKKDDNSNNLAGSSGVNNPTGMSFGNYNENNNINNNVNSDGINVFSLNSINVSRDNKFMNSNNNNNNLNNSIKQNAVPAANNSKANNDILTKDILNNLNLRQMQGQTNSVTSTFKEMNTSPFLKNKSNASERNLISKSTNLPVNANNNVKSINNLINKSNQDASKAAETRNLSPNPTKTSSKFSNSNLNENKSFRESPIKTNKSVDNIIVPPKKFRKRILYMSEITKIGFSGQSNKKFNQDNYFIYKNFNNDPNSIYMSVCDGHGVHGHEVSGYLKENLPVNLSKNFSKKNINLSSTNASDPSFQGLIKETFITTNNQMTLDLRVDTNFSGSTCVSLIYTPTKLTTINVGDSRAVLGRLINGVWTSHDLSNDHKPSEANEAARIKRAGGRIEPYTDENNEFIGPPRVWLKEEDIPGLAMTRSFGDKIANIVGVTCEPEITEWELTPEDKFFIIASDGVWEFIESEECVNILKDYYLKSDHKGACEHLLKEASKRWMKEEEVIDDITMIVVFLE